MWLIYRVCVSTPLKKGILYLRLLCTKLEKFFPIFLWSLPRRFLGEGPTVGITMW